MKNKKKKKASQKLAGITGGIGDETREEQASVPETREDRVPRSGMLNASEEKRKIKLRRQHYLRQKKESQDHLGANFRRGVRGDARWQGKGGICERNWAGSRSMGGRSVSGPAQSPTSF